MFVAVKTLARRAMASSAGMRRKRGAVEAVKASPYFSSASNDDPPPRKRVKRPRVEVKFEPSDAEKSATGSKKREEASGDSAGGWKPVLFEKHYAKIREMRAARDAPVDSMGAECCQDKSAPDNVRRFQTLVSLLLSSMTKDEVTAGAMTKLIEHGLTVPNVLATSEDQLKKLIYPVGFYSTKAANLRKTAAILHERHHDDIPPSIPGLVALPGIGPKMAHLCMLIAWDEVTGIGVDTHVHRISNRLKWVRTTTKTPEETRKALEEWLPKPYWRTINLDLVGFGQQRCLPVGPKCAGCLLNDTCPKFGVGSKKKSGK